MIPPCRAAALGIERLRSGCHFVAQGGMTPPLLGGDFAL